MTTTTPSRFHRTIISLSRPHPVRLDLLEASTHLPGKAAQLVIGLWILATLRQSPIVILSRTAMARVGVSRYAATDALRRLEEARIALVKRRPGKSPIITLIDPGTGKPLKLTST